MLEAAKIGLQKLHDRIKELKAENTELKESKKCYGCKRACIDGTYSSFYQECKDCIRSGWDDLYEPKVP